METFKYRIIKDEDQYRHYCERLETLLNNAQPDQDETELLTLLIENWDEAHRSFTDSDPIVLLRFLMEEQGLKPKDLVEILGVSKGLVSDILNYRKGLSREVIRKLASYFKLAQEAFNQPYKLKTREEKQRI